MPTWVNTFIAPVFPVWAQATGGQGVPGAGGAGGATFPGTPGIVYNTSTTASRNATASDIETTLGSVYLPLTGGTLTGALTIASACSSGTCTLLTAANNAGNWSGLNVFSTSNMLTFQASNQFSGGYKSFMGVSASNPLASGFGPGTDFYGIAISCAGGNPNNACLGGTFQSPSLGILNLSEDYANTIPLTLNLLGTENVSVAINSALYQTKTHCASAASPAVCAASPAGFVSVAASSTRISVVPSLIKISLPLDVSPQPSPG